MFNEIYCFATDKCFSVVVECILVVLSYNVACCTVCTIPRFKKAALHHRGCTIRITCMAAVVVLHSACVSVQLRLESPSTDCKSVQRLACCDLPHKEHLLTRARQSERQTSAWALSRSISSALCRRDYRLIITCMDSR